MKGNTECKTLAQEQNHHHHHPQLYKAVEIKYRFLFPFHFSMFIEGLPCVWQEAFTGCPVYFSP